MGTGHCLEDLGGYQMGTDVQNLMFFTSYSLGSAAGENFDVTECVLKFRSWNLQQIFNITGLRRWVSASDWPF